MNYSIEEKKQLLDKLELYRLEKSLTIQEMATLLNVGLGTATGWEHRKQLPRKTQCYRIQKLLKDFVIS